MYRFIRARVVWKEILADGIVFLRLKAKLRAMPGQFFIVSVPGYGECPLASCSYARNRLDVLVRDMGGVTRQICKAKRHDILFVRGPYGNGFPLQELETHNIVLVAGGTGIAPVFSLADYIATKRKYFRHVLLVAGFRNPSMIFLKDKLEAYSKKMTVAITVDKPDEKWTGMRGNVCQAMKKFALHSKDTVACICGPEPMMKAVTRLLLKKGFSERQIYVSMERRMECGHGACGRCMIDGLYVCKDGPVFRYDMIKDKDGK